MASGLTDSIFTARTLVEAGIVGPTRPDRAVRSLVGLQRWGSTLTAGYLGAAAMHPNAMAIIDEVGILTFAEVNARTSALAQALAARGVSAGENVAIMCRNHRGFIEASVASSKLGANALYLNTAFAAPQTRDVIARERPVAVIYDQEFAATIGDCVVGRPAVLAWVDDPATAEHETLEELIASAPARMPSPPAQPGRTVILTSGTTGTPKGANRPSPSGLGPAAALLSRIPLRSRETTVIAAPMFHSWGFVHLFLSTALASTLVLRRRFDPVETLRAVAEHRASALIVVPVMLQRILELGDATLAAVASTSLRVIASSGSALPGPLAQQVMDVFGDKLYNLYGSTEVAWASIATPEDLRAAPGTAGRPPRGTVVKILNDAGREVADGGGGRIFVGSELLFDGYTGGEDKLRLGGLMSTGDVGHFDADGRLFVDGRDDDMIISGGENVFPGEVEDVLAAMPGVREAAVVGVADDDFGQRLRAYVVPTEGSTLTEPEVRDHVRAALAAYKVPRDVLFVEQLPRNATGKVLKRELNDG